VPGAAIDHGLHEGVQPMIEPPEAAPKVLGADRRPVVTEKAAVTEMRVRHIADQAVGLD
jgi:hypothetical protein